MKLFTSLAVIASSLGEREEGQSLVAEGVALALSASPSWAAVSLLTTGWRRFRLRLGFRPAGYFG